MTHAWTREKTHEVEIKASETLDSFHITDDEGTEIHVFLTKDKQIGVGIKPEGKPEAYSKVPIAGFKLALRRAIGAF